MYNNGLFLVMSILKKEINQLQYISINKLVALFDDHRAGCRAGCRAGGRAGGRAGPSTSDLGTFSTEKGEGGRKEGGVGWACVVDMR